MNGSEIFESLGMGSLDIAILFFILFGLILVLLIILIVMLLAARHAKRNDPEKIMRSYINSKGL